MPRISGEVWHRRHGRITLRRPGVDPSTRILRWPSRDSPVRRRSRKKLANYSDAASPDHPKAIPAQEHMLQSPTEPTAASEAPLPAPSERLREALAVSLRGCDELLPETEWLKKLARSEATGQPLRVKLGLDPTAPDIQIGRAHV